MNAEAAALTLAAPAKINLYLDVLDRRADGYHEIVTYMAPLALADELTFAPANQLSLTCDDPSLPLDENNLVLRAAQALQRHSGSPRGAAIHLNKRVPHAAGLGGGSSDAASTLRGLNRLWQTKLPDAELMTLAAQLGSDVPFFLANSAAWCRGRGERVEPVRLTSRLPILLICPNVGLSTAAVYQAWSSPGRGEDGSEGRVRGKAPAGADSPSSSPVPRSSREWAMREALERGDAEQIGAALFNRLQPPAERLLPLVAEVRQLLDELAPEGLYWGHQMSGSGSGYFVVCRGEAEAQRLARLVFTRWVGGVLITGMGTAQPKDGPPERTLRLYVTHSLESRP
jgi:4-diphosphocytidyl-2-C-methyl-D-erythritol kinase